MAGKTTVIAFDLYGTLLSTDSIAGALASHFSLDESAAGALAALWRRYQLEYTWRVNSMGIYRPFSTLTLAALNHAVSESSLPPLSSYDSANLMKAYDSLSTFPEVPDALATLAEHAGTLRSYIFSNGTYPMISASVAASSSGLSPFASVFRGLISVENAQVFKPAPKSYEYLLGQVDKSHDPKEVWLVSSNPFDVVGAVSYGLRAVWVDRTGKGWVDELGSAINEEIEPTAVVKGVDEAVEEIIRRS